MVLVPKKHIELLPFTRRVLYAFAPHATSLEPASARQVLLNMCDPKTRLEVESAGSIMQWWEKNYPDEGPILNLIKNVLGYLATDTISFGDTLYCGWGHLLSVGAIDNGDSDDAGICWVFNAMLPLECFEEFDASDFLSRPMIDDIYGLHPLPPKHKLDERIYAPAGNA